MEIPVEVTVTSVVVYPDRARVTVRGHTALDEGAHQIIVGELPLAMEPDSIRAAGSGTARVRLRSVDVQRRHYAAAPAANVIALEEQINKLQMDLQALIDQQAVKQASIDHLEGLRQATTEYARGLARGRSTIEQQAGLMRFFEEEDERLRGDLRVLDEKQRDLKDELAKLQAELDQIRSARPRQRYEARMEIESLSAGNFEVEVTYVVGRAGWRPLYDMRLRDTSAAHAVVAVSSLAEITQNTGQDWAGVQLSVSTARPALNQRVPELKPWYIDVPRPTPRAYAPQAMAKSARMESMEMATADEALPLMASMAPPPNVAAEVDVAEVQESGTAVTFRVSGDVNIPGDGTPKKTALGQNDLTPELDFLSVPRHTDAVYRRAKLINATGAPLLAGPISLYVGDEFIGQNRLEYTPTGGEVELILGVEERVTVRRELVRRDVDKRLLRDQRQIVYGYEIKLENLLSSQAKVTVQDQFPVSRHDQIKVRLDRAIPEPVEQSDLHILKWQLNLAPGEKKTIQYDYQVEHPRGLAIAGLVD
jgi:uncharacterized protein (TIGR02231 family)